MRTRTFRRAWPLAAAGITGLIGVMTGPAAASDGTVHTRHVLLLSVDGMHQADLAAYVRTHPRSALAGLASGGTQFTAASTPFPSDSFPGMVGQVTGGDPKTTGIYYDVTYNHALIDPSASAAVVPEQAVCGQTAPGANVAYDESIDRDNTRLDAGQGLPNLPGDILEMTGDPRTVINPAALPIDPRTCSRVYPHSYLKVNTVFEVAKAHGLRTAWSDKHPAYEILSGPSGDGLDDLFTPEINSTADAAGHDWTSVNALTQAYDHDKVQAVLHEIDGYDHSGRDRRSTPAIFGMNFQSVSTAQKLPVSSGEPGGYDSTGTTPGPVVSKALDYVDGELGAMIAELKKSGRYGDTTIILSAKHGQSPMDSRSLKRIDDGAVIDALNAAWQKRYPAAPQPLVAASADDDGMLLWFTDGDRTPIADAFAENFLRAYAGNGTGKDGQAKATAFDTTPVAYTAAGLSGTHAGPDAAAFIGTTPDDPRVPDLIGIAQHGVVYTGKTKKIAEHGGDDPQDRNVPLVVSGPGIHHGVARGPVETTSIAPTILTLLGLDPEALQAVRAQHTPALDVRS
ncbi:alkaline phosphatase family protein [Amycolatopsis pigmentata]|uniref:Alkaline phosphatase family protein n=1 Tax=Amycolatopsis pigmentata TaxID=450801 RepID=A0ABW5FZN4_9PSEU